MRFSTAVSILHCALSKMANIPSASLNKTEVETVESFHKPKYTTPGKDKAAELLASNERIIVTVEESKRVLRKIDFIILPILLSVYFLQSLDKTVSWHLLDKAVRVADPTLYRHSRMPLFSVLSKMQIWTRTRNSTHG